MAQRYGLASLKLEEKSARTRRCPLSVCHGWDLMLRKSKKTQTCQLGSAQPCLARQPSGWKTLCLFTVAQTKAYRTASTTLCSSFTGTAFQQEAGAMTGVTARQRAVTAPASHLETLPETWTFNAAESQLNYLCFLFGHRRICLSLFIPLPYFFFLS